MPNFPQNAHPQLQQNQNWPPQSNQIPNASWQPQNNQVPYASSQTQNNMLPYVGPQIQHNQLTYPSGWQTQNAQFAYPTYQPQAPAQSGPPSHEQYQQSQQYPQNQIPAPQSSHYEPAYLQGGPFMPNQATFPLPNQGFTSQNQGLPLPLPQPQCSMSEGISPMFNRENSSTALSHPNMPSASVPTVRHNNMPHASVREGHLNTQNGSVPGGHPTMQAQSHDHSYQWPQQYQISPQQNQNAPAQYDGPQLPMPQQSDPHMRKPASHDQRNLLVIPSNSNLNGTTQRIR